MSYPIGEASSRARHRTGTASPAAIEAPPPPPLRLPFRAPIPSPSPSPSTIGEHVEPSDATTEASNEPSYTPASTDVPIAGRPPGDMPKGKTLATMQQKGLSKAAEMAFRGVGEALNDVFAEQRPAEAEPDEIWLATDDEARGVGEPTGRMIARRIPDLPADQASDAADLIALAIPLAVWGIRGLIETAPRVRRARRAQRAIAEQQEANRGNQ